MKGEITVVLAALVAGFTTVATATDTKILEAAPVAMRDYQAHLATMRTDWKFGEYAVDISKSYDRHDGNT